MQTLRLVRSFGTSGLRLRGHYDVLGIHPKATQADVKSAYYKLSMLYHPDKNKDSAEAAKQFRDITEAYEVLGNVRSRKLYDRGLFIGGRPHIPEQPINKFYKSRETKSRPPAPPGGRTTVYDFDEWSKAHYEATFARDLFNKRREKVMKNNREETKFDIKSERMIIVITLFLVSWMFISYGPDADMDKVRTSK